MAGGRRRGDPLPEELSGAGRLPSPASGQSSGHKDWSWGLGEAWGEATCGKRGEKPSANRPEVPPRGCPALPAETERLCLLVGASRGLPGASEAHRARPAVAPPHNPAGVLGARCRPLPNVNSDGSQPHAQHRCLIKRCMVASCSVGAAPPHPTTSAGGFHVAKWRGRGFYYTKALSTSIFPSLLRDPCAWSSPAGSLVPDTGDKGCQWSRPRRVFGIPRRQR